MGTSRFQILGTPLRRGALCMGLALLLAPVCLAALSREAWQSGDAARMRREAQGDVHGTLLAGTLEEQDALRVLLDMGRLEASTAPAWMRVEALRLMCECSCVMGWTDSLHQQSQRFKLLAGEPFTCPLPSTVKNLKTAPESVKDSGGWWLQCGAYSTEKGAGDALKALGRTGLASRILRQNGLWKVQLGPLPSQEKAESEAQRLRKAGRLKDYRVVRP